MKHKRIHQEREERNGWSRWVQPVRRGYLLACCDCGLVHRMNFRINGGRTQFRAQRAWSYTNRERKRMKRKGKAYTDHTGRTIIVPPAQPKSARRIRQTTKRAAASLKRLARK